MPASACWQIDAAAQTPRPDPVPAGRQSAVRRRAASVLRRLSSFSPRIHPGSFGQTVEDGADFLMAGIGLIVREAPLDLGDLLRRQVNVRKPLIHGDNPYLLRSLRSFAQYSRRLRISRSNPRSGGS